MRSTRRPTRRQWIVAVCISFIIHGCTIGGWLWHAPARPVLAEGPNVLVDAPDDITLTVTLRDMPLPPALAATKVERVQPPAPLPEKVRDVEVGVTQPRPMHGGDVTPVGGQSGNTTGAPPLHGGGRGIKSIVYVLDRSSSMTEHLALAKARLLATLQQLEPEQTFQVVAYNSDARSFGTQLQVASEANIARVKRWMSDLQAEGRSEHRVGVREALAFKSDAVLLLTDADDLTSNEVRQIAGDIRHPVALAAIIFGNVRAENSPLEQLTKTHRGSVRYVGNQP